MSKKIKFGHTAITWDVGEIEQAIEAIAACGYWGTETFGWVLESWHNEKKDLKAVFDQHDLELTSLYVHTDMVNPANQKEDMDKVMEWVELYEPYNSPIVIVGSKGIDRKSFSIKEHLPHMVETLNELAKRIEDRGKICCFHPHTGTAVETEEEIRRIMEAVDSKVVKFAPDSGQIGKGGSDPLQIIKDYHEMLGMVHLKDYIGGPIEFNEEGKEIDKTGFLGYTPLGEGALDIEGIVKYLEEIDYDGYASVELDGNQWSQTSKGKTMVSQKEALEISKQFLQNLGYTFKS